MIISHLNLFSNEKRARVFLISRVTPHYTRSPDHERNVKRKYTISDIKAKTSEFVNEKSMRESKQHTTYITSQKMGPS